MKYLAIVIVLLLASGCRAEEKVVAEGDYTISEDDGSFEWYHPPMSIWWGADGNDKIHFTDSQGNDYSIMFQFCEEQECVDIFTPSGHTFRIFGDGVIQELHWKYIRKNDGPKATVYAVPGHLWIEDNETGEIYYEIALPDTWVEGGE